MKTSTHSYHHGEQELQGFLAVGANVTKPSPAVLVAHDWSGQNEFARQKAVMLAEMGYAGFALDMFGKGKTGETNEEKQALIKPLLSERWFLAERMLAAFETLAAMPEVDSNRIAAIGFCFGGLCVLDLARSGAKLRGVVSFHGLLNKPHFPTKEAIQASILVLHGFDDPMVSPDDVTGFCQEMTDARADWQVHQYGHTKHGFTNPQANDPALGTLYNVRAEKRSFEAMTNFLKEVL